MCSRRLAAQPPGGLASAERIIVAHLLNWEHASVTSREALGGPEAAPSGSGGTARWSRAMLGSADASGACHVAAYGRRRAHIAPSAHSKKNACNGRIYSRLSARNHDISGLKSSFIPPVRLLEACGAHRSALRTCRSDSNSPYVCVSVVSLHSSQILRKIFYVVNS